MLQRTSAVLLLLAVTAYPQRRVDPKNTYHRIVCVAPLTGSGTAIDPVRPKYAPWPLPIQQNPAPTTRPMADRQTGIIGFSYVPSDDGRYAIVEFVARARSAFQPIFSDSTIQVFEKGRRHQDHHRSGNAEIPQKLQPGAVRDGDAMKILRLSLLALAASPVISTM